jgi:hypothetical protein
MIQRIQSLWLLAAAACEILTFKFPFYSGNKAEAGQPVQYTSLIASGSFLILSLTAILFIGAFFILFLFKKRKLQFRLGLLAFVLSLLNIFLYYRQTSQFINGTYSITSLLSLAVPVLFLLAARGISRDEKLVKSMDRLR